MSLQCTSQGDNHKETYINTEQTIDRVEILGSFTLVSKLNLHRRWK